MRGRCGRCATTSASETSPGRWAGIPRTSLDERGRTLRSRTGGEFAQGHAGSPLGGGGRRALSHLATPPALGPQQAPRPLRALAVLASVQGGRSRLPDREGAADPAPRAWRMRCWSLRLGQAWLRWGQVARALTARSLDAASRLHGAEMAHAAWRGSVEEARPSAGSRACRALCRTFALASAALSLVTLDQGLITLSLSFLTWQTGQFLIGKGSREHCSLPAPVGSLGWEAERQPPSTEAWPRRAVGQGPGTGGAEGRRAGLPIWCCGPPALHLSLPWACAAGPSWPSAGCGTKASTHRVRPEVGRQPRPGLGGGQRLQATTSPTSRVAHGQGCGAGCSCSHVLTCARVHVSIFVCTCVRGVHTCGMYVYAVCVCVLGQERTD